MSETPLSRPRLSIHIQPFSSAHDASSFSCGNAYIDRKLRNDVMPMHELNLCRAFVAVEPGKNEVLGFYSMMPHSIEPTDVPDQWQHLITNHTLSSISAAYIALFATRERCQGRGVGKLMMTDALRRIKKASDEALGIYAVILDAIDQKAFDFYLSFGFQDISNSRSMRMFYLVSQIP